MWFLGGQRMYVIVCTYIHIYNHIYVYIYILFLIYSILLSRYTWKYDISFSSDTAYFLDGLKFATHWVQWGPSTPTGKSCESSKGRRWSCFKVALWSLRYLPGWFSSFTSSLRRFWTRLFSAFHLLMVRQRWYSRQFPPGEFFLTFLSPFLVMVVVPASRLPRVLESLVDWSTPWILESGVEVPILGGKTTFFVA